MESWQTLAQFPEFAEVIGTTAPGTGPTVAPGGEVLAPAAGVARSGLPWEHREQLGLVKAFSDTLIMVLTKPVEAFQVMRTEGGLVDPVLYAVIGGSLGFIVYFLFTLLFGSFGMMGGQRNPFGAMFGGAIGTIFVIIFCPILIALSVFIGAGIIHLCLMLVGGAKILRDHFARCLFRNRLYATATHRPVLRELRCRHLGIDCGMHRPGTCA